MKKSLAVCTASLLLAASCTDDAPERKPREEPRTGTSIAPEGYGPARLLGHIEDDAINESSGLVASSTIPGSFWTHNDSGGRPFIFCIMSDGRSCGAYAVSGAGIFDWEDIARGPGPETDISYLYIGDIGDNTASRSSVVVYRIPEPSGETTAPATELVLTYPDGPHDAETLMIHPKTGDLYIVSKGSDPVVYVARAPVGPSTTMKVAGKAKVPGLLPGPTGGDISPNGRRVVLSLYTGAVEYVSPPGRRFDAIWRTEPDGIDLPVVAQREAIAYTLDGRSIVTTSEGRRAPIHRTTRSRSR
jgi:hypothetical protein